MGNSNNPPILGLSVRALIIAHPACLPSLDLQSLGVGREKIVLLHLPRGFPIIEWILATLKAGAAFVYLDPTSSKSRKELTLSVSDPLVVVDDSSIDADSDWLAKHTGRVLDHTLTYELEFGLPIDALCKAEMRDLAYIIFTSGTTGEIVTSNHRFK